MGRKEIPKIVEDSTDFMKYSPLILIAILIGVCYFLYKRINKHVEEIEEIKEDAEKYDNFMKDQAKHNTNTVRYVEMLMKGNPNFQKTNQKPAPNHLPVPDNKDNRLENIKETEEEIEESGEDSIEEVEEVEEIVINTGKKKGVINIIN